LPKFSLYGGITQVDRDRCDATTAVDFGTNYWFNRSLSINFGLGVDVGVGVGVGVGVNSLRSLDLLASYRF
jgi:hypothetical protein